MTTKDELLKLVSNTETPSDVLAELAFDEDLDVRAEVAGNLSTPPEVLSVLAASHDDKVRNFAATNPSTPYRALSRIASNEFAGNFPRDFGALGHLKTNPMWTHQEILPEWETDGEAEQWDEYIYAANDDTHPNLLNYIYENIVAEPTLVLLALNRNSPQSLLEKIATNLFEGKFSHLHFFEEAIEHVPEALASNPNSTSKILDQLYEYFKETEYNGCLGYEIAQNLNSSEATLLEIYEIAMSGAASEVEMLAGIASNPNTPAHLLEKLSADRRVLGPTGTQSRGAGRDLDHKHGFIYFFNSPQRVLSISAPLIIEAVAGNKKTPLNILETLSNDEMDTVRQIAKKSIKGRSSGQARQNERKYQNQSQSKKQEDSLNGNTGQEVFERLEEIYQKRVIALDNRTPAKTLLELAKENEDVDYSSESDLWQFDTSLAICVASNVGAPNEVLKELLSQNKLRQTIARNPNCSLELLQELTKDADLAVRRNVARNPCASLEILEQLANDVEEDVRSAVASNPNTLSALLKILANDESDSVRTCAYYNIGASDEVRALAVLNGIEEKSDDFAETIKFLRSKTRLKA